MIVFIRMLLQQLFLIKRVNNNRLLNVVATQLEFILWRQLLNLMNNFS